MTEHEFKNAKFMEGTAPNNPTPEVERSEDNPEQYRHWTHDELVEALILERKCSVEEADAISRLTAEKDCFEARLLSCDENLTHTLKAYTEMTLERDRAERANKLLSERIEGLVNENRQLRLIVSESASACGAYVSPECSIEFMSGIPNEITLAIRHARSIREAK